MRTDQQIQRTRPRFGKNPPRVSGRGKAGERLNFDREVPETSHGGGVMLLGQYRGGDQNRRLFPVQRAFHNRP